MSIVKADVGSLAALRHTPEATGRSEKNLDKAKASGLLVDCFVCNCGDDLEFIMTLNTERTAVKFMEWCGTPFRRR